MARNLVGRWTKQSVTLPFMRRGALLRGTALSAVVLGLSVPQARAQGVPTALAARAAALPSTALPTGGQVVAGAATIAQSGNTLAVTQTTATAGVNWRSFDVGTAGTVSFTAPSAQSLTINRVTGPDPSVIAGRITANDRLVLINQSGVVFTQGSQVNAQSLVVSAIGITDANLKAGRVVLDQPAHAGAAVINQGGITVAQTGLAALVAPQVANSGVIRAPMGRVILAGAEAATVDLYGDGLMSIDVTRQVTTAPLGPDGKPVTALVTNTGTIIANGGTVLLTAAAAEGIVTNLVTAGGRITANTTASGKAGTIVVDAVGGGAAVTGRLSAQGRTANAKGGQIQVNATGTVGVGKTAVIDASGQPGGGVIALGTTLARARGGAAVTTAATAKQTLIAPGAQIAANATKKGDGGQVTVLSTDLTYQAGSIAARGGPQGGDGGAVEISGFGGFRLVGAVDVSAPLGLAGRILIDPQDLTIGTTNTDNGLVAVTGNDGLLSFAAGGATTDAFIDPTSFNALTGIVTLQASRDLFVNTPVSYNASILTLQAGRNLTINAAVTPDVGGGALTLISGAIDPTGAISIAAAAQATTTLTVLAGSGGMVLAANLTAPVVDLSTTGTISQTSGVITAGTLQSQSGAAGVSLNSANSIDTLGTFIVGSAAFSLTDANALTQTGTLAGGVVALTDTATGNAITLNGSVGAGTSLYLAAANGAIAQGAASAISTPVLGGLSGGNTVLSNAGNTISSIGSFSAATATLQLATSAGLGLGGTINAGLLDLSAGGSVLQSAGTVTTSLLQSTGGIGGNATVALAGNQISTLGGLAVTGSLQLRTDRSMSVTGAVTAANASVVVGLAGATLAVVNPFQVTAGGTLSLQADTILAPTGLNVAKTGLLELASFSAMPLSVGVAAGVGTLDLSGLVAGVNTTALHIGGIGAGTGTASSIVLGGLNFTGLAQSLQVSTTGNVTQSGLLAIGTLTGSAGGSVTLTNAGNQIGGIGAGGLSAVGSLQIANATTLQVAGPLALTGAGTISIADNALSFVTGGSIAAAGGTVELGPLTAAALQIGTTTGTGLALGDLTAITAGTLRLGQTAINGVKASSIGLAGNATTTAGTLELDSSGAIAQNAGTLTANTLTGSASTVTLAQGGNAITSLGNIASAGSIAIAGGALSVTGTLTAGADSRIALTSPSIAVAAGGALVVPKTAGGGIVTLAGDTITVPGTISDIGGTVALAPFTAGGTLHLGGALLGDIAAPSVVFGSLDNGVTTTAGSIDLASALTANAATTTLSLYSTGAVTQASGAVLTIGTLTGTAGSISLTQANAIARLGPLTTNAGGIAITDAAAMTVGGAVTAAAGNALTLTAGSLTVTPNLANTLRANGGIITLATDTLTLPTGPVAGLVNAGTGTVALTPRTAGLAMGFGSPVTGFNVSSTAGLTGGTIELGGSGGVANAGSLAVGAATLGGTVILDSQNGISQTGALSLPSGSLVVNAGGNVVLGNTGNAIASVGRVSAGNFTFQDGTAPNFSGLVSAGTIALTSSAATGMTISGTLNATSSLALNATNAAATAGITELAGGVIVTPTLTASIGSTGTIALIGTANQISGVGTIAAASGTITLADTVNPNIAGPVTAVAVKIGNTGTGGIDITGPITATGSLTLTAAGGNITQAAASKITTPNLSGTLTGGGNVSLLGTANAISGVTGFADAGGVFRLTGTVDPHVTGTISAGTIGLTDSLGGLTVTGTLTAANVALVADAMSFAAGSITGSTVVELAPYSAITTTIGTGSSPGGLFLLTGDLATLHTPLLRIGAALGTTRAVTVGVQGVATVAPALELDATTLIALGGTLAAQTSVNLLAPSVTETATSVLNTPLLTGTATNTALTATGNTVTALSTFNAGNGSFALTDAHALTQSGTLTAGTITLRTVVGGLTLTGALNAVGGVVDLSSVAGINQTAGAITAGTLQSTSGVTGAVSLGQSGNAIGTLANFNDGTGAFALTDAAVLAQMGTLTAGTVSLTDSNAAAAALTVGGTVNATTSITLASTVGGTVLSGTLTTPTLDLSSAAGISQTGGTITASVLQSTGGATGPVSLGQSGNAITTLSTFNDGTGAFSLIDSRALTQGGTLTAGSVVLTDSNASATALTIGGTVTAPAITLVTTAGGIGLTGTLNAGAGFVDLSATGNVTQTAGAITAGTLQSTGGVGGNVTLSSATNAISTLGGFAATGFSLTDASALTQTGTLGVTTLSLTDSNAATAAITLAGTTNATNSAMLNATAGGIVLTGTLTTGTLDLDAVAGVSQTAGSVTASVLTSSLGVTGPVSLGQAGNQVTTLSTFNDGTGSFSLVDARALTQSGVLTAGTISLLDSATGASALTIGGTLSAPQIKLVTSVGGLVLAGAVNAGGGTVDLDSVAGISQTAGAITAGTLTSSLGVTGAVTLGQAGNSIATLSTFNDGTGAFSLVDTAALTQTGVLTAGSATLSDTAGGAAALSVAGTVVAPVTKLTATVGGIALSGSITAGATLDLNAAAGVNQTAGAITAGTLTSSGGVTGAVSLGQSGNAIGTLASFTDGSGAFSLTDAAVLAQTGTLTAGTVSLTDSNGAAAALTVGGTVNATTSLTLNSTAGGTVLSGVLTTPTLDLSSAAGISQTGGVITANVLQSTGGVTGNVSLGQVGNAITTLSNFNDGTGAFSLIDSRALTQAGTLTAGSVTLRDTNAAVTALTIGGTVNAPAITLATTAGGMTLAGALNAGAGVVDLSATGNVTQSAGVITAGTLQSTGGVGGNLALSSATNAISTLGGFSATGFSLTDASALTQTGTLGVTTLSLTDSNAAAAAITLAGTTNATNSAMLNATTGGIALTGTLTTGTLDLDAVAGVSQTGGSVTASVLTSSLGVTGPVSLGQAGNQVTTLSTFNDGTGSFSLVDARALTQSGVLTAGTISLLDSATGVSALSVSGTVVAPMTKLTATAGGIVLSGSLTAGATLDLNAAAGVSQTAGAITAGTLTSSAGVTGNVTLGQAGNSIATLSLFNDGTGAFLLLDSAALTQTGVLTAGSATLSDTATGAAALTVAGTVVAPLTKLTATVGGIALSGSITAGATLDLNAAAGVNQTAGAITAGTLTSSGGVTGPVSLSQAGNAIGTLATFNDGVGAFSLNDAAVLAQTGTLTAGTVSLSDSNGAASALTLGGTVNATTSITLASTAGGTVLSGVLITGTLDLSSAAGVSQTGGAITAGVLQSSGGVTGGVSLGQTGNAITTLSTFNDGTGAFSLTDGAALSQTGTLTAASVTLRDSKAVATALTIGGTVNAPAITLATTAGGMTLAGALNAGAGVVDLSATGNVAQSVGTINAGTLQSTGGVGGNVALSSATNAISTLGGFAATGFSLTDASALTQTGTLGVTTLSLTESNAATAAITLAGTTNATTSAMLNATTGGIALTGTLTTGTLDLDAVAGVSQTAGSVNASVLTSSLGVTGPVSLGQAGNQIATLSTFNDGTGSFALTDGATLTQSGVLTAGTISLLDSATGTSALTIGGTLTAPAIQLVTSNGGLTLAGTINAGSTGTLDLDSAAGVNQTAGAIVAGTLTSSLGVTGAVSLLQPGNVIGVVAGFDNHGAPFALFDSTPILQTGTLNSTNITLADGASGPGAITIGGTLNAPAIHLLTTVGGIVLNGVVNATSTGTVDLDSAAGINQTGGSIVAGTLLSSTGVTGTVSLGESGNAIGTLANFNDGSGAFALVDAAALGQTGTLTAGTVSLTDSNGAAIALTLGGTVNAATSITLASTSGGTVLSGALSTGTLDLSSAAGVFQTGGTITAGVVQSAGGVTGNVSLGQSGNAITTLSSFNDAGSSFSLTDGAALSQTGVLTAAGVTLRDSNASATALTIGGTVAAPAITLVTTAGGIGLTGTLNAGAGVVDLSATGNVAQTAGAITTGTLQSAGGVGGNVVLSSTTNAISTLGGFSATGFSLTDASALTQTGTLGVTTLSLTDSNAAAAAITLAGTTNATTSAMLNATAGGIALTGTLTTGTLDLDAAAGVSQTAGSVTASVLTSSLGVTGPVSLGQAGNQVTTLSTFNDGTGSFSLVDARALTQSGVLTAGTISLLDSATGASALTIGGTLSAPQIRLVTSVGGLVLAGAVNAGGGTVDLDSVAGISQTAGAITAGTLTSSLGVTGAVTLGQAGNSVVTLATFNDGTGAFSLVDAAALTQTGVLTAGSATLSDTAGGAAALSVAGTVVAPVTKLTATVGGIALSGSITAGATLDLNAAAGVNQTAGAITAGTLTSSGGVTGAVSLGQSGNAIGTLATFTDMGAFSLVDAAVLAQTGTLTAGTVSLSDSNGAAAALTVGGTVNATTSLTLNSSAGGTVLSGMVYAGTLDLSSAAGVFQTGGAISSIGLQSTGGVTGPVSLGQSGNAIGVLSTFNDGTGAFSLRDSVGLSQAGVLTAGSVGIVDTSKSATALFMAGTVNAPAITLSTPAGGMTLAGALNAGTGVVDLSATGNVTQTAGAITAGTLQSAGGVGGNVTLSSATNAISTLGGFSATGFSLTDASALTQTGTLAVTTLSLTDSNPAIAAITLAGTTNAATSAMLDATAGGIALTGTIGTGTLDLSAAAGVSQTAGGITASVLTSSFGVGGAVTIGQAGNQIGTLSSFNDGTGIFTLVDAQALTQVGTLIAGGVSITDTNTSVAALTMAGLVDPSFITLATPFGGMVLSGTMVTTGVLDLGAALGISQTAGLLNAATLQSTPGVTGNVSLGQSGNTIATLATFNDGTGNFALVDAVPMTQTGVLTAANVALTDAGSLALNGVINGTMSVTLTAGAAGISESGSIVTPLLSGLLSAPGAVTLAGPGNVVSGVGSFSSAGGSFALVDTVDPNIAGTVSGNVVAITNTGAAGITVTGTLSGGGQVSLTTAGGGVREASGTILAGTLASPGGIVGGAQLTGAGNQIGTIGGLSVTGGALSLVDATSLTLAGPVSTSSGASLNVTGGLTLAGTLSAPGQAVSLTATGPITQPAGIVTAGTLSASGNGVALGQANRIGFTGTITSGGAIALVDAAPLVMVGAVSGTDVAITTTGTGSGLNINAPLTGRSSVTLNSAGPVVLASTLSTPGLLSISTVLGDVTQPFGTVSASQLASPGGIAGSLALTLPGNLIGSLGAIATTGSIALQDAQALVVAGPLTMNAASLLSATGGITLASTVTSPVLDLATGSLGVIQTAGVLNVGTLTATGTVVGPVTLVAAGNQVGTLGATRVTGGDLTLVDGAGLAVAGPLSAPNVMLVTPGAITLPGVINTGTLSLSAGGTITRALGAGSLTVGTLTGQAGTLADFGKAANISTLGAFTVSSSNGNTGQLALDNAQPLAITGPLQANYFGIVANDLITVTGTITTIGLPAAQQRASTTPVDPGSYLSVRSSGTGAVPTIHGTGLLVVQPPPGVGVATLRLDVLLTGGNVALDNLVAPQTNLVVFTNMGGTSSGLVSLLNLVVVGQGGSSSFTGSIANTFGQEAARLATIEPKPVTTYRFNACPIGSVNCVVIPLVGLPGANPLRDFFFDTGPGDAGNDDLALPDVSNRDY